MSIQASSGTRRDDQQEFRLRDVFNRVVVEQLADSIARVWPALDRAGFVTTINSQLDALTYGKRNALIRDMLRQNLMIDYVVYHMKANGKLVPKVFKLVKKQLRPGETLRLTKHHPFRPRSTRVYYPGRHALELQINGKRWGWQPFELMMEH